jgi:hypothetical protein
VSIKDDDLGWGGRDDEGRGGGTGVEGFSSSRVGSGLGVLATALKFQAEGNLFRHVRRFVSNEDEVLL